MQNDDKGQLRKLALLRRNELDAEYREAASLKVSETLLKQPLLNKVHTVMCYVSFRSELSTHNMVSKLKAMGKELCFPVCEKNGLMRAWQPLHKEAWKTGMMGICEPDVEMSRLILPEEIGLVICPMVAFDDQCRRMGYGGGYYDRYLPKCKNALRIGIAFESQRVEKIITDDFDQPMDIIITEEKIYKK